MFIDRTPLGSDVTKASSALQNATMYALAINTGSGVQAGSYMTDTIGCTFYGAQLTQADVNVMCDELDKLVVGLSTYTVFGEDECDGDIINAANWTSLNLDATAARFYQHDGIVMDVYEGVAANSDYYRNFISSNVQKDWGVWRLSMMQIVAPALTAYNFVGLKDAATYSLTGNKIQLYTNVANDTEFQIVKSTTVNYSINAFGDIAFVKFVVTPTHKVQLFVWSGSAWVQIGADQSAARFGPLQLAMATRGITNSQVIIRDVIISNIDSAALNPA